MSKSLPELGKKLADVIRHDMMGHGKESLVKADGRKKRGLRSLNRGGLRNLMP
jgi:hypothetical protein